MKLNTFFSRFIPKEDKFYPILRDMSDNILAGSDLLIELTKTADKENQKAIYKQIKTLETKGDHIVAHLFNELNNTFITPFDREDINALSEELDNVLDCMTSAAKRVAMYQPDKLPKQSVELALLLKKSCELIQIAVKELATMKKSPKLVKDICTKLHKIENQADDLYEHFIIDIFEKEKNGIELIKLKEIMQEIERATDKADSVGKIIKTIIVKYA
jgi:predicted phosphate transport protein (TIGR00153 family)